MPVGYGIDEERQIVLSRAWGILTDGEVVLHARALAADPRFAPHYRQLTAMHDVTRSDVSASTVEAIASEVPFGAGARRAIVVSSDTVYGMARMFELLRGTKDDEIVVFRDMDAALKWLGLVDVRAEMLAALAQVRPLVGLA
jgi:hypothetical protein